MARQDDDRIEQAAKRLDDDLAANAIHTVSRRLIEVEAMNAALLNALTRYRTTHDQQRWGHDRPCRCDLCTQAEKAIKAATGGV